MNYTLKELTSMPFEDWAALIEIESAVNPNNENEDIRQIKAEIKMQKFLGTIDISQLRKRHCNFSPI